MPDWGVKQIALLEAIQAQGSISGGARTRGVHAGYARGGHGGGYARGGGGGYYAGGGPIYNSCGYGYDACPGYGIPFVGGIVNGVLGGY